MGKGPLFHLSTVGRLDFAASPGVFVGGSVYTGRSGQGQFKEAGRTLGIRTTIGEAHVQAQLRGFDLRALYARASLDDVAALNRVRGLTGADSIGDTLQGGYVQFGYNILSRYTENMKLTPYYRYEAVDTHESVPEGFLVDPARDRRFHSLGVEFRPIPNIAVKGEYQWVRNRALTGLSQFNINLGYSF